MIEYSKKDLLNLYDLLYEEDEYIVQNVIRCMLRVCKFDPDTFKKHLSKYIHNHRNSRESVESYKKLRTAMYAPFSDLPKITHTFSSKSNLSVVQWRLKIGV